MSFALFDKPIYAQRRYFVQEITGLDDVFGFLDEWPQAKQISLMRPFSDIAGKRLLVTGQSTQSERTSRFF